MWNADAIEITIEEAVHPTALVQVRTPFESLLLLGSISIVGRSAWIVGVHIQDLQPGALGRAGLNRIGERLLVELDVDQIVIEEALERQADDKGRSQSRSGSLIPVRLRMTGAIDRPIDFAKLLMTHGLSLRDAHTALDEIATGKTITLRLHQGDGLCAQFSALGVSASVNIRDDAAGWPLKAQT